MSDLRARAETLLRAFDRLRKGALHERLIESVAKFDGLPRAHAAWALGDASKDAETVARATQIGAPNESFIHALIMSGNVFTAAWPPIFWTLVLGHRCHIRLSSRNPGLVPFLCEALQLEDARFATRLVIETFAREEQDSLIEFMWGADQVTVFGGDATVTFMHALAENHSARFFGHGHALGMVVLDGTMNIDLTELARDLCAFDARGCMSPLHVAVLGSERQATTVGLALETALSARSKQWPRGKLSPEEQARDSLWRDTAAMQSELFEGDGFSLAIGYQTLGCHRNISVAAYPDISALLNTQETTLPHIRTWGLGPGKSQELAKQLPTSWRGVVCPVGSMQQPASECLFTSIDGIAPYVGLV